MDSQVDYYKVEKLGTYYHALKKLAEIQQSNSLQINDLWAEVAQDKNIKTLHGLN